MIKWYASRGCAWFRVFGFGLACTNHRVNPPLFSERYGYRKRLHIGHLCFKILVPGGVL